VIDLHNHVLPGVDDGAANMDAALRMLEIAAQQGITHVACTPHANDRMTAETNRLYQSVFLDLQEAITARRLPVELALASEIMVGTNLLKLLSLPLATFHDAGKYFLLEFPTETPFEIILNVVKATRRQGQTPLIAHFERFPRAQRTAEQPQELRTAGAILTLDAGSLVGQFGSTMVKRSKQLLKWKVVDILASDAHNDGEHGFCLKSGRDAAAEIVGDVAARQMVLDHPRIIWDNLPWPERQSDEKEMRTT
jgi:protein-tyrosine phosphatase